MNMSRSRSVSLFAGLHRLRRLFAGGRVCQAWPRSRPGQGAGRMRQVATWEDYGGDWAGVLHQPGLDLIGIMEL